MEGDDQTKIEQCLSELHEGKAREILERHIDKYISGKGDFVVFGGVCIRSGISWRLLSFTGAQTRDLLFPF